MSELTPEHERIQRLEREVGVLRERLERLEPRPRRSPSSARVAEALERRKVARWSLQGEQWTGRVGLVLLFLGLVFLFRYSVEQGWITPPVRVAFGAALGAGFLVAGLRMVVHRASYGALLLAGSVATFYATGWAASYLYELLPRPIAVGWMAGVTVLAFTLARRFDQPALASLGALGGFATPFLLRPGSETVTELVVYTTLVVLWTAALYVERGWRSVLWTYLGGALAVFAVAIGTAEGGERWLVQGGILVTWLAGAAYPFVQEWRASGEANPRPGALVPFALELRLLGAGGSAAALAITTRLWSLPDGAAGALFLTVAALYAAFAWLGTRTPNFVARSAAPVAGALLATGVFLVLGQGADRWLAVSLLGAAMLFGGSTVRFRGLEWVGHGLFALLALQIAITTVQGETNSFDALALANLTGVVLAGVAARYLREPNVRLGYRAIAHVLLIAWLGDQFAGFGETTEWVTVAWGIYGGVLLLLAIEGGRGRTALLLSGQAFAGSALGLAVLKLLVIDMAQVSALVRIPLFLGAGLVLLGLSALFQRSAGPGRRRAPRSGARPAQGRSI